jgi:hypothetical protein
MPLPRENRRDRPQVHRLLAEAETETYGNNASGIFCDSFRWPNPQFPLSLARRLLFLREIFEEENTSSLRLVAVRAIESSIT